MAISLLFSHNFVLNSIASPLHRKVKRSTYTSVSSTESAEDDFVPYTYVIEILHDQEDDHQISREKDKQNNKKTTETKRLEREDSPDNVAIASDLHAQKTDYIRPRLKSEDIKKIVEVFIEEGHDKSAYDHKAYDKFSKGWDNKEGSSRKITEGEASSIAKEHTDYTLIDDNMVDRPDQLAESSDIEQGHSSEKLSNVSPSIEASHLDTPQNEQRKSKIKIFPKESRHYRPLKLTRNIHEKNKNHNILEFSSKKSDSSTFRPSQKLPNNYELYNKNGNLKLFKPNFYVFPIKTPNHSVHQTLTEPHNTYVSTFPKINDAFKLSSQQLHSGVLAQPFSPSNLSPKRQNFPFPRFPPKSKVRSKSSSNYNEAATAAMPTPYQKTQTKNQRKRYLNPKYPNIYSDMKLVSRPKMFHKANSKLISPSMQIQASSNPTHSQKALINLEEYYILPNDKENRKFNSTRNSNKIHQNPLNFNKKLLPERKFQEPTIVNAHKTEKDSLPKKKPYQPNVNFSRFQDKFQFGFSKAFLDKKPCLSPVPVTANPAIGTFVPHRGPGKWYTEGGPPKGQIDIYREKVYTPILKAALCL